MCDLKINNTKTQLLKVFSNLEESEINNIRSWISSDTFKNDLDKMQCLKNIDNVLVKTGNKIKKLVPLNAELPSENIVMPNYGDNNDCTKENTCHVDSFLYDEDDIEDLVKQKKLSKYYCCDCKSRSIDELIFISHSLSRLCLEYIFKVMLPLNLENKKILDIGSRLGTVLYAAYYLTNASSIVGVEINKELFDVQEKIKDKIQLHSDRIKNMNANIMDCAHIISESDVIILNALDFFVDSKEHIEIWKFFKKTFKKDAYLVTNRCLAQLFLNLHLEDYLNWVTVCKPCQLENEILFDIEDMDTDLFLYKINSD